MGQFRSFYLAGIATSALMLFSGGAYAQIDQQTGIADPSRAGDEVKQPEMPTDTGPVVSVKEAKPINAPAGAEKITFKLNGINVEGATVYSAAELQSVYASEIGKTISLADFYTIANKLTLKYRNDGYILTQVVVPPQEIDGGTPKLLVVEGYVDAVTVQKEDESAPIDMENIKHYASQISTGGPLNAKDLERELLIINDLPGITARSILSPSTTKTGAADLLIILTHDPVDGIVSLDDYGSRYLGPIQVGAATTLNSLLGQNEAISAQLVMAPQSWYELAYGSVGYEQPIGIYGTKIHFNASATDTDPGYDLEQFHVNGRSYLLNVGLTHPFIRSRTENLYGRLNFDWRRVKSENNIEDTRRDRISSLRLGGRYEFIDTLVTAAANTVDVELSKGVNIFGASEEGDENMTRDLADPEATKLEAEIQRLQRITDNFNVLLAARGQIASNALLSSEEFGVGGINSGRGYDPSEIVGDQGVSGKVELQWREPLKLDTKFLESYQLFSFYDIGKVWNTDATTSGTKDDSLTSVGFGVRMDLPMDVDAGFAVAFPLTRDVQTQSGDGKDPKYYFNLSKRF
ncbi:MAG: ShlB/FhaC/HecB family hemolysin secretion/activation protein [Micavibrio aeruginosavorus]|uniref:ShlB/FhaC/HecB family hemolysin secretion/activation protein n=1 Tax=Micavibrio aeruginosavorus TaxID=349221 RepID=A0A2W5N6T7_9BACT|nr:MAG: ShlB/FhaC/HecB family hemolysin secretion/activation protein [Micavibrio aeruginosavorus]